MYNTIKRFEHLEGPYTRMTLKEQLEITIIPISKDSIMATSIVLKRNGIPKDMRLLILSKAFRVTEADFHRAYDYLMKLVDEEN